jgi:large conductance mechanosensitive channel
VKGFVDEFKQFIMRGNVLDLAIGIIIGAAFNDIVKSLVNDIIMPPIGMLLSNVSFNDLFITLSDGEFNSLAEAQAAGAATINYGLFINTVINFLIIALVVFMIVRQVNRLTRPAKKEEAPAAPIIKECPYCFSTIPIQATRCAHCTSQLEEKAKA